MEKIELALAAEHIEDYCSEVECRECAVRKLCEALGSDLPLADQIRRAAEDLHFEEVNRCKTKLLLAPIAGQKWNIQIRTYI